MKAILLIDDDSLFRKMLSQWLSIEGWQVFEADDGEQGLELAAQHRPGVVLCDLRMPRLNGYQVCRTLRSNPALADTRIIITSGSHYELDRRVALEAGADAYLVKPIKPGELVEVIEKIGGDAEKLRSGATVSDNETLPDKQTIVRFWGVRGSIPTPGPSTVYYGGNTSCVEVRAGGKIIVLDAGSGIRPLGQKLVSEFADRPMEINVLITHTHWDHIQGFPFFVPAYNPQNSVRVLGFDGARKGLEGTLSSQMESPYFPISLQQMPGHISIQELKDLKFSIGDVRVEAAFMNHPGVCVGYRLFTRDGSIAYMPDNELFQRQSVERSHEESFSQTTLQYAQRQDQKLIDFVRGTDVLILDAQYSAEEYPSHVGWGHSCVEDSVAFALSANVKHLFLFHHDPNHDDEQISKMLQKARQHVAACGESMRVDAAREGVEVTL